MYVLILIFIYIPEIQKWLQPLNIEHAINQSVKAPCKHSTGHKMKHNVYIQEKTEYKNSSIKHVKFTFVLKMEYGYS
jgi:hypothetical protein